MTDPEPIFTDDEWEQEKLLDYSLDLQAEADAAGDDE